MKLEIKLTVTKKDGEDRATALVRRDCSELGLEKGQIIAYSNKGKYALMTNCSKFCSKYFPKEDINICYYVAEEIRILTGEISLKGDDLWGHSIKVTGSESPYN